MSIAAGMVKRLPKISLPRRAANSCRAPKTQILPQKTLRKAKAATRVASSRTKLLQAIFSSSLPVMRTLSADSMAPNGQSASTPIGLKSVENWCRIPSTVDSTRKTTRNVVRRAR